VSGIPNTALNFVNYVQRFVKLVLPNAKNMLPITIIVKNVQSLAKRVRKLVPKKQVGNCAAYLFFKQINITPIRKVLRGIGYIIAALKELVKSMLNNLKIKNMKPAVKIIMAISLLGTIIGCKPTFNAAKTLQVEQDKNAIYNEIISNPAQLANFLSETQKSEEAKKILMMAHIEQMESGNMEAMMNKNPEMKGKMQSHMQSMIEKNPEMEHKMMGKMMANKEQKQQMMIQMMNDTTMNQQMMQKMMEESAGSPSGRKMRCEEMMNHPEMMKTMMDEMHKQGMMDEGSMKKGKEMMDMKGRKRDKKGPH